MCQPLRPPRGRTINKSKLFWSASAPKAQATSIIPARQPQDVFEELPIPCHMQQDTLQVQWFVSLCCSSVVRGSPSTAIVSPGW
eukprot:7314023-Lingulodinium_polyedra.AAC.1